MNAITFLTSRHEAYNAGEDKHPTDNDRLFDNHLMDAEDYERNADDE